MKYTRELLSDTSRLKRQKIVWDWGVEAFGSVHMQSHAQRGLRMVEEAIELAQACGCDRDQVKALVDFIYDKPKGKIGQEIGGVGVTLLALAESLGFNADMCEAIEIARVLDKPFEHFAARNAAKNAAGFDAGAWPIAKDAEPPPETEAQPMTREEKLAALRCRCPHCVAYMETQKLRRDIA